MDSTHNCFLCTNLAKSSDTGRKNWSRLLCQILHLPHYYENNIEKTKKSHPGLLLVYCDSCTAQLSNVQQMLDELEMLEKKIFDAKFLIKRQLKNSGEFDECGDGEDEENLIQELRIGLIEELKSVSMGSMLSRIGGGRVDNRKSEGDGNTQAENVKEQNMSSDSGVPSASGSQKIATRTKLKLNQSNAKIGPKSKRGRKRKKSPNPPIQGTRHSNRHTAKKPNYSLNQSSEDEEGSEYIEADPLMLGNDTMSTDSFGDAEADTVLPPAFPLSFPNVNIDPGELANLYREEEPVDIKYSATPEFLASASVSKLDLQDNTNEPLVEPPLPVVSVQPRVKITTISENTRLSRLRRKPITPPPISENQRRALERRNRARVPGARPSYLEPKVCDECGKVLATRTTWLNHVRTFHKNEFKFKCNLCDYGCQWKTALTVHMSVHSQDRPFMCEFCSKCFKLKDRLDKHLKYHNPDHLLRFQCDQCDYKAPRPADIKRHAMSHTDIKPFHCNICGKDFRRKYHLYQHQSTVHGHGVKAKKPNSSSTTTTHVSSYLIEDLLQPCH